MRVMEGESVTLHNGVENIRQHNIRWYFNGIQIAEINGEQIEICTDVQCTEVTERFRGRLILDETGSLTIRNIRTTDAGEYRLEFNDNEISTMIFNVTVIDPGNVYTPPPQSSNDPDINSAQSSGLRAGIRSPFTILMAVVPAVIGFIYYRHRSSRNGDEEENEQASEQNNSDEQSAFLPCKHVHLGPTWASLGLVGLWLGMGSEWALLLGPTRSLPSNNFAALSLLSVKDPLRCRLDKRQGVVPRHSLPPGFASHGRGSTQRSGV
ncbi:uncharacterized protein LOC113081389 [Carassius auratus]|uniref:Uncharacterized protein LOC113081389 n=1 Tax=Carassius auratus TaxID=7957 RepID=A0A6P6NLA6_CARAU|nr:uncharacterized protein LOC113081389 [Carassius auratus]